MPEPERRALGVDGEAAAGRYLERRGFRILARNVRTRYGELDLICRDGEVVVFVEVKTRRSDARVGPLEAISAAKAARLVRLGSSYVAEHWRTEVSWRIDLVAVIYNQQGSVETITHIPNAVEAR